MARHRTTRALFALSVVASAVVWIGASSKQTGPRELGAVRWTRDLDSALTRSAAEGKPAFVLFQEVPGCSTCVSFGDRVLSHPRLVEAIETEFIPVFIYNNRGGLDAKILERYDEPAWNNPVVRFVNGDGRDLIPRQDRVWTPHAMAARMIQALEASGRTVPRYLTEAADEIRPRSSRRATFGMACYWSGEACLGELPGVLESRTGSLSGSEVTELRFDPEVTSHDDLVRMALGRGCAERVLTDDGELREASVSDQKYYLHRSPLRNLALSPRQAVRVNAALASGRDPLVYLSPRQRAMAAP